VRSTRALAVVTAPQRMGYVDITDDLLRAVARSGIVDGFAVAYCAHTTCALIINEWEDGVLSDLRGRLEELVPTSGYYAHDDLSVRTQNLLEEERANGRAHVAQMILGNTSHAIPVEVGKPCLGRWQRLFMVELDEPKPRTIRLHVYGS
jgi:secondary thiamine-phosphate synthase enzyme